MCCCAVARAAQFVLLHSCGSDAGGLHVEHTEVEAVLHDPSWMFLLREEIDESFRTRAIPVPSV